ELVRAVAPRRAPDINPLFTVALSYLNVPRYHLRMNGLRVEEVSFDAGRVRFDLDLFMREHQGAVEIDVDYRADLFDEQTITRFLKHYLQLLGAAAERPDVPVADLGFMDSADHAELARLGSRDVTYPAAPLVHERIAERARTHPHAAAVHDSRRTLTYSELDGLADGIARRLMETPPRPGEVVAVLLERSAEFAAALLAVLKTGAAYLPLDPAQPHARLAGMLEDGGARTLVTTPALARGVAGPHTRVVPPVPLPRDGGTDAGCPCGEAGPEDTAYVIYTSGSTGQPKGVLVTHSGLLNLCHWHIGRYGISPADRGTMTAGLGFDATVWELWPYLVAGASVAIADDATRSDPARITRWLIDEGATMTFLPTPLAEAVLEESEARRLPVRYLLTGGDRLRARPSPSLPFTVVNHYGPTECTVVASAGEVADTRTGQGTPSIGRPIDNVGVYLLDRRRRPVPRGAVGRIFLGGVQLARGYLNRDELTRERFVRAPEDGRRLYDTGDLARWRNDGTLEFIGRGDRQLKIRGFRIEPGEIEAQIQAHPAVGEAVVTLRGEGGAGKAPRLIAYLSPAAGSAAAGSAAVPAELRQWLRGRLPEYMVPGNYVTVPGFPMTPNGKIDYAALPDPGDDDAGAGQYVAPRDDLEGALADIFSEILGRDVVGIRDSFFDLGGHSLLAVRLASRLWREFGVEVPVPAIFSGPTVEDLAVTLTRSAMAQTSR
ncbi:MAG: non-ribosomal peptide synthetase, partial [Trebonia sp.]